jgi:hypothetical protein
VGGGSDKEEEEGDERKPEPVPSFTEGTLLSKLLNHSLASMMNRSF